MCLASGLRRSLLEAFRVSGTPIWPGPGVGANKVLELIDKLWKGHDISYTDELFIYDRATVFPRLINWNIPLWISG